MGWGVGGGGGSGEAARQVAVGGDFLFTLSKPSGTGQPLGGGVPENKVALWQPPPLLAHGKQIHTLCEKDG